MEATTTATQLGPPALAVARDLPMGIALAAPWGHRREPPTQAPSALGPPPPWPTSATTAVGETPRSGGFWRR